MAVQSVNVPTGYTLVAVALPTEQVTDFIEAFASAGGYNAQIHGEGDAAKTAFAKVTMADHLSQVRRNYRANVLAATEAAAGKQPQIL